MQIICTSRQTDKDASISAVITMIVNDEKLLGERRSHYMDISGDGPTAASCSLHPVKLSLVQFR